MKDKGTVFVVDDDAPVRDAMRVLLKSVGLPAETYASAEDFLSDYDPERPGCVVLDVRMPGMGGLALQEQLVARGVDVPVIFITGHGDVPTSVRAMKGKAFDFLEKPFSDELLLELIHQAIKQDIRTRETRAGVAEAAERVASLTPREREVLALIVDGKPTKIIASELGISEKTTQTHRARVMEKMGVRSLGTLIRAALKAGMDPDKQASS